MQTAPATRPDTRYHEPSTGNPTVSRTTATFRGVGPFFCILSGSGCQRCNNNNSRPTALGAGRSQAWAGKGPCLVCSRLLIHAQSNMKYDYPAHSSMRNPKWAPKHSRDRQKPQYGQLKAQGLGHFLKCVSCILHFLITMYHSACVYIYVYIYICYPPPIDLGFWVCCQK